MSGVNKVILIGRLGKDPEVRNLENGATVASFSMATTEYYKDKVTGEKKEITEWHNVSVWRGLAETASKYLHKGDLLYVEGRLRTRSWEKDGVTRYSTEIVGDNMNMLSPKPSGGGNSEYKPSAPQQASSNVNPQPSPEPTTDDLPF